MKGNKNNYDSSLILEFYELTKEKRVSLEQLADMYGIDHDLFIDYVARALSELDKCSCEVVEYEDC